MCRKAHREVGCFLVQLRLQFTRHGEERRGCLVFPHRIWQIFQHFLAHVSACAISLEGDQRQARDESKALTQSPNRAPNPPA